MMSQLTQKFLALCCLVLALNSIVRAEESPLRIGIIGLDTSHAIAFTKEFNQTPSKPSLQGLRVTAAYPYGSKSIESSASRIPQYTKDIEAMGVKIVDSIDALLAEVDCVLLETNDGTLHAEQALQVFQAGKPVFIDKPVAASLNDVVFIYRAAEKYNVPMFSSSSLRYSSAAQAVRSGSIGKVTGCDAYSPCSLEPSHSDLYWYGIHGVETLYTVMGTGCQAVTRVSSDNFDVAVGQWQDGRIGTFRGIRSGAGGYGGTAFGEKGVASVGPYEGYGPLVDQIGQFFRSGQAPIPAAETIELYAFMEAAAVSKQKGGIPVTIESVMTAAEAAANRAIQALE
jgi:predicted dehydrogenase